MGSLWASQVRGYGYADPVPDSQGAEADVASEWWRAGGARGGQHPLMALEVVKPLMRQDLERLSDQASCGDDYFYF